MAKAVSEGGGRLSVSTEDYLKAIWAVGREGSASTKEISEHLSVAPASVTNMLGRLQEMGFVRYERYRGASLTEKGYREALRLVRKHRLIETFLLEHLGYSWQEVHEEAERLEHAVSDLFTERLAEYLGHPGRDPHGDPIPAPDGTMERQEARPLAETAAGERVRISRVDQSSPEVLEYFGERGLVPGRRLRVTETRKLDGVIAVEDEEGNAHTLGAPLARSVFVERD
ncbi:iron (metal) dependent repressor, DtxR family [Rubrobacter xylanophilus DSM 9941]|uniref:Manganese transport regulator n=1 Tax=Rubrobacter xylanophilus (strain DSM 9941 / JCM 11954 / NBRC 16129 / PRD-1) TaxID=266117 RepID=Q1AYA5_RUBXD|nr:metal-dependent transcriptional regulator [Rubrobacter xylanophilus]ABG03623.1 iron (metal) dependent repressor, DtxR family [Rubrobacter xylanophilus DSM 9941]